MGSRKHKQVPVVYSPPATVIAAWVCVVMFAAALLVYLGPWLREEPEAPVICPPGMDQVRDLGMWVELKECGMRVPIEAFMPVCEYEPGTYNALTWKKAPEVALDIKVACPRNTTALHHYHPLHGVMWMCAYNVTGHRSDRTLCPFGQVYNVTRVRLGPDIKECVTWTGPDLPFIFE